MHLREHATLHLTLHSPRIQVTAATYIPATPVKEDYLYIGEGGPEERNDLWSEELESVGEAVGAVGKEEPRYR